MTVQVWKDANYKIFLRGDTYPIAVGKGDIIQWGNDRVDMPGCVELRFPESEGIWMEAQSDTGHPVYVALSKNPLNIADTAAYLAEVDRYFFGHYDSETEFALDAAQEDGDVPAWALLSDDTLYEYMMDTHQRWGDYYFTA